MGHWYTAKEAAALLNLNYHTLLARARRGKYDAEKFGWSVMFPKSTIDKAAKNASSSQAVEKTAR